MTHVVVGFSELSQAIPRLGRRDTLEVRGGGVLHGASLTGIDVKRVDFLPEDSLRAAIRAALPGPAGLREGRDIPIFDACDFSGLTTTLNPGISRFIECTFGDVLVDGGLMLAHFVHNRFSGKWEANFSGARNIHDPVGRTIVRDNDMTDLTGMDFFDVAQGVNRLDEGGKHLVLTLGDVENDLVAEVLGQSTAGRRLLERLRLDRSPSPWVLVERETLGGASWLALQAAKGIPRGN